MKINKQNKYCKTTNNDLTQKLRLDCLARINTNLFDTKRKGNPSSILKRCYVNKLYVLSGLRTSGRPKPRAISLVLKLCGGHKIDFLNGQYGHPNGSSASLRYLLKRKQLHPLKYFYSLTI